MPGPLRQQGPAPAPGAGFAVAVLAVAPAIQNFRQAVQAWRNARTMPNLNAAIAASNNALVAINANIGPLGILGPLLQNGVTNTLNNLNAIRIAVVAVIAAAVAAANQGPAIRPDDLD